MDDSYPPSLANINDADGMDLVSQEPNDLANLDQSQSVIPTPPSTANQPSLRLNSLVLASFPWFSAIVMTPTAFTELFPSMHYAKVYSVFLLASIPR
jgi:hypothetical protein